jgi:hypothetical protein
VIYGILSILIVVACIGLGAVSGDQVQQASGNPQTYIGQASSAMFLTYRNAVLNYLEANAGVPSTSGAIPMTDLTFPTGLNTSALPATVGNYIVVGEAGERTVYIWQPAVADIAESLQLAVPGDATIGTDLNGQFLTLSNQNMGAVPAYVPSGDVLSVVQLGG